MVSNASRAPHERLLFCNKLGKLRTVQNNIICYIALHPFFTKSLIVVVVVVAVAVVAAVCLQHFYYFYYFYYSFYYCKAKQSKAIQQ
jgi:hypothetical protein